MTYEERHQMADREYTPYQRKIINRYYEHADDLGYQKLSELVTEIYLAEGKKADRLWKQAEKALTRLKVDQAMKDHLLGKRDPAVLAEFVKDLTGRK
jgi:hypothetical protein